MISVTPALSVVVVPFAGRPYLLRCLDALSRRTGAPDVEIVVPCDERIREVPALQTRFPEAHFVAVAGSRTPAELRAIGVRQSGGAIVALTEDHCIPDPDWCAEILRAHAGPHAAVGGVLDKDTDTALNWAVYLCDFSRYMTPVPEGPAGYLTDCNVSYKRSALAPIAALWAREFHETSVNWALRARGESLWLSPRIVARQQRSLTLGTAVRDRYAFGRLFASTRVAGASTPKRLAWAALSGLLPPLLVARIARNVLARRRRQREFVRALPAIVLTTGVWALGEFVGYVTGRPGTSLSPARAPVEAPVRQGRLA